MPRASSTSPRCSSSQRPQRIGRASSPAARALPSGSRSMTCDHHGIELQTTCLGISGAPAVPPFLLSGAQVDGSSRADHRAAAAFHMLREKSSRNPVFAVPHVEAAKRIRVETSDAPPFPPPLPLSHLVIVSSSTSEVSIALVTNISSRSFRGLVLPALRTFRYDSSVSAFFRQASLSALARTSRCTISHVRWRTRGRRHRSRATS